MNNREKATLFWLGVVLVAVLLRMPDARGLLWQCVTSFVKPAILGPVVALAGWTVGLIAASHAVGLWKPDVRNDTVTWFITAGIAFLFSLQEVEEDGFLRRTVLRTVAAGVFVEGFVNLAQFGLLAELVLLPAAASLVLVHAVAATQQEWAVVHRFLTRVLSLLGSCLIGYSAVRLATDFNAGHTVRALLLPVWLTLGTMPFIYAVGLSNAYRQAYRRIDLHTDDRVQRRRAKWTLLRAAHLRAAELGGFGGHWISDLATAESSADARAVTQRWEATWRSERRAERLSSARTCMREWLTQRDAAVADIHESALRRAWPRLDREQRAMLKVEGLRVAPRSVADEVRGLPD